MGRLRKEGLERYNTRLILIFFYLVCLYPCKESFALRCNKYIVSEGDLISGVLKKCSKPALKNTLRKTFIKEYHNSDERKTYVDVEYWLYDFGPGKFIYTMEFNDSKLINIKMGGYGGKKENSKYCQEPWEKIDTEYSKPQVIIKCGKPDKIINKEEFKKKIGSNNKYDLFLIIKIEEWIYDFGSRYLWSVLRFENGILKNVFKRKEY